tara:strand:- start:83 stop:298 length:216 start_codon:yes stop_codon:yes gene_type:complete
MTEVIPKKFEENESYWEERYTSILSALLSIDSAGISLNQEDIGMMNKDERVGHLEAIAMKAVEYEWEQNAI